jgi:hypothetical protein
MPEIAACFLNVETVYGTKINSWQDGRIRSAVEATGRRKVICASITGGLLHRTACDQHGRRGP